MFKLLLHCPFIPNPKNIDISSRICTLQNQIEFLNSMPSHAFKPYFSCQKETSQWLYPNSEQCQSIWSQVLFASKISLIFPLHLWRQALLQGIDAAVDEILGIPDVSRVRVAQRPVQSRPVRAFHPRQHVALLVLQSVWWELYP